MTDREVSINLDKPLLEQQSVQELLNLFEKEDKKIRLEQLMEVAKVVVTNELAACGCSKNELIALKLEYQLADKKSEDQYVVEWKRSQQEISSGEGISAKNPPRMSDDFHTKLFKRLSAELPETAILTASHINFREAAIGSSRFCMKDPTDEFRSYLREVVNGVERWVMEGGARVPCGRRVITDTIPST